MSLMFRKFKRKLRLSPYFPFCFMILLLSFTLSYLLFIKSSTTLDENTNDYPILIWWTPNFSFTKISSCSHGFRCRFDNSKLLKNDPRVEGFMFYGTEFNIYDLPLPRKSMEKIWALLHEESPRNMPILSHESALTLFNFSSTISRYSDVPLTLQYLNSLDDLIDNTYYVDTEKKNELLLNISPILYIQSDCDTSSYRDNYVKELMKYIPIDSYGICLNNKNMPDHFTTNYLNKLDDADFLHFVSQYKFTVAIENGICEDYITEKLWRPLKVGSIPIYLGSPSIRDWLPNEHSAILINDFESVQHLAKYINYLNENDNMYEDYLQHKIGNKITNKRLIETLKNRTYNFINSDKGQLFVEAFECFICKKVYEKRNGNLQPKIVSKIHYNCSKPVPPQNSEATWWLKEWDDSMIEADILNKHILLENKIHIDEDSFQKEVEMLKNVNINKV